MSLAAFCGTFSGSMGLEALCSAVESLYDRSRSLVCIAVSHCCSKSDLFLVHVGLRQSCPLSPVLFIIFMDRISRHSQGLEGAWIGSHRISSLLFADNVVLLAPSSYQCSSRSNMVVVLVCRGEERAELKGEALNLPVILRSYPHLWS